MNWLEYLIVLALITGVILVLYIQYCFYLSEKEEIKKLEQEIEKKEQECNEE